MQFLWSAVDGWCFLYFLRLCLYISFVFTSFFLSFNLQVKVRIYPDWMTPGVPCQGSTRTDKWMDGHLAETVLQAEQMNEATSQWVASSAIWQTFKVNFWEGNTPERRPPPIATSESVSTGWQSFLVALLFLFHPFSRKRDNKLFLQFT